LDQLQAWVTGCESNWENVDGLPENVEGLREDVDGLQARTTRCEKNWESLPKMMTVVSLLLVAFAFLLYMIKV
jgi:uncharacterized protein YoxC